MNTVQNPTGKVSGWLHARRQMKGFSFLIIRNRHGLTQVVASDSVCSCLADCHLETVVEIEGNWVAQKDGVRELQATHITVISRVAEPPPVAINHPNLEASLPVSLDEAALTLRHPQRRAIFELHGIVTAAFRHQLRSNEFVEIHTPKLVSGATEGGANVFEVKYFEQSAFLAQSPQFYKQTMVGVFERVFEIGPVFRAEPHATVRHLAQYTSMDVEVGFIKSHREIMAIAEGVLRVIFDEITKHPVSRILGIEAPVLSGEIPILEFHDAHELAAQRLGSTQHLGEPDLAPEEERVIGEWGLEQGSALVFIEGYPLLKRPFYTHPGTEHLTVDASNSFDLLFNGLELITGGQRLHDHNAYLAALESRGMCADDFESYLRVFRYGMPPHGGFAIGLERLLMQLLGCKNIRETTLFPRDRNRLTP